MPDIVPSNVRNAFYRSMRNNGLQRVSEKDMQTGHSYVFFYQDVVPHVTDPELWREKFCLLGMGKFYCYANDTTRTKAVVQQKGRQWHMNNSSIRHDVHRLVDTTYTLNTRMLYCYEHINRHDSSSDDD
jgi:hypothetical protein